MTNKKNIIILEHHFFVYKNKITLSFKDVYRLFCIKNMLLFFNNTSVFLYDILYFEYF